MLTSKTNKIIISISAIFVILLILFGIFRDKSELITLQKANELLRTNKVKEVIASKDFVYLKSDDGIYKIPFNMTTPSMFLKYKVTIDTSSNIVLYIFIFILIIGGFSIIFRYFQKKSDITAKKTLKSKELDELDSIQKPIIATKSDVSFDDIGGISDVKEELQEIIDFMKNPQKYKNFGARLPRGVLLVGPPGVGKTMIAKAVANAAGVSFYYQSGASFVQIYVGMGAKRVHELFTQAKQNAPAIIFIDEIDAVGKKRDGKANDEREATLNQLLTEMDGFESQSGVIVIAATNKIDVLDPALLRAGRFDRRIFVNLPTKEERASILQKYLKHIPNDVDIKKIASITVGFNGATLAAFVNEATLLAIRKNNKKVTMEHFYAVKDKVMFGKKKLAILNEKQKKHRITYQSAKVIVATYFDLPFEKILLANERLTPPNQDDVLLQSELEARIKMLLAGIVLCDMKYNEHLNTAQTDLEEAKKLIQLMIECYGMGETLVAKEGEVSKMLEKIYEQTKELLISFEEATSKVEEILSSKESISKDEVKNILNDLL